MKRALKPKKSIIKKEEIEITPLVKSLTGVVADKGTEKSAYADFLRKKYINV